MSRTLTSCNEYDEVDIELGGLFKNRLNETVTHPCLLAVAVCFPLLTVAVTPVTDVTAVTLTQPISSRRAMANLLPVRERRARPRESTSLAVQAAATAGPGARAPRERRSEVPQALPEATVTHKRRH